MAAEITALARAGQLMLVLSALYEPVRFVLLYSLGAGVGGVGGVGGLTNLGDPAQCSSAAGRSGAYCYTPGVAAGFTVFGLIVLLAWVVPPLFGAIATAAGRSVACPNPGVGPASCDGQAAEEALGEHPWGEARLLRAWSALSCLWFLLPLACNLSSPFYRSGVEMVILAIALAAAFPLSWHLALVAVPVSALVAPHMGLPESAVKNFHKAVGWRTAGWAVIHGFCELFYLSYAGLLEHLSIAKSGENLIYILGMLGVILLVVHCAFALSRKQQWLRTRFRAVHGLTAAALLLCATAHWWPFALFLLPASAAHGGAAAARTLRACDRQVSARKESLALAAAAIGALLGLAVVWAGRDRHMQQPGVDMLSPFAFPPLALLAEYLGAWAAAALQLWTTSSPATREVLLVQHGGSQ